MLRNGEWLIGAEGSVVKPIPGQSLCKEIKHQTKGPTNDKLMSKLLFIYNCWFPLRKIVGVVDAGVCVEHAELEVGTPQRSILWYLLPFARSISFDVRLKSL